MANFLQLLARTSSKTLVLKFLVSTDLLVQVCLIRVGAKLSRTVVLQELGWTTLVLVVVSVVFFFKSFKGNL